MADQADQPDSDDDERELDENGYPTGPSLAMVLLKTVIWIIAVMAIVYVAGTLVFPRLT
jgi:hypothetical protein